MREADWQFIADEAERETCAHWWSGHHVTVDGRLHTWTRRCTHPAKFKSGYRQMCGYHTPGVGRKGARRVRREAASSPRS